MRNGVGSQTRRVRLVARGGNQGTGGYRTATSRQVELIDGPMERAWISMILRSPSRKAAGG